MPVGCDDRFVIRRDVLTLHRDLFTARHNHRQMIEKAFGIDRRHTTRTRRRNRLPVKRVLHVTTREHSGNVGRSRMSRRLQVSNLVHIQLPFEQLRETPALRHFADCADEHR